MRKRLQTQVAVFATLLLISSAAPAEVPLPEFYGVYVVVEGNLFELHNAISDHRLKAQRTGMGTERYGVGTLSGVQAAPTSYILFFGPELAEAANQLVLLRLEFVRTVNQDRISSMKQVPANFWAGLERIPSRVGPVAGKPDLVRLVPSAPLPDGVYAVAPPEFAGEQLLFTGSDVFVADFTVGPRPEPAPEGGDGTRQERRNPAAIAPRATKAEFDSLCESMVALPLATESEQAEFGQSELDRQVTNAGSPGASRIWKEKVKGQELFAVGRFAEAVQVYERILSDDPLDWDSHVMLGAVYGSLEEPELALGHVCIALKKQRTATLFALAAQAKSQLGASGSALTWLDRALEGGFREDRVALEKDYNELAGSKEFAAVVEKYKLPPPLSETVGRWEGEVVGNKKRDADMASVVIRQTPDDGGYEASLTLRAKGCLATFVSRIASGPTVAFRVSKEGEQCKPVTALRVTLQSEGELECSVSGPDGLLYSGTLRRENQPQPLRTQGGAGCGPKGGRQDGRKQPWQPNQGALLPHCLVDTTGKQSAPGTSSSLVGRDSACVGWS